MRTAREVKEDQAIYNAISILERRVKMPESYISAPADIVNLLRLRFADKTEEVFTAIFLDARHGVIAIEDMFFGNKTGAAVYVGNIVKRALMLNACAMVISHNHPSGIATPSSADRELTERVRQALALVEIRLLDHVVVGAMETCSFSERGWL